MRGLDKVTYAETHGGAGRYLASGQNPDKSHISRLRTKVAQAPSDIAESSAGSRYFYLLRDWWTQPENKGAYPGSVLQVATYMHKCRDRKSWEIRVTEADPTTFTRLTESLSGFDVQSRHDGFQNQLDWLTEPESLILLVDPFTLATIQGEDEGKIRAAKERALSKGDIDLETLQWVFYRCWKKNGVIMFWCSFTHKPGARNKRIVKDWLGVETARRTARLRWYRHGVNNIAVVGCGKGSSVVDSLPGTCEWKGSWMAGFISEEV